MSVLDAPPRTTLVRTSPALTYADKAGLVPLEELKLHLRILGDDEDAVLARCTDAAYDFLVGQGPTIGQGWLNGCLLLQETVEYVGPLSGLSVLSLPLRPVAPDGIISFESLQPDGTYEALDEMTYRYFAGWPDASFVRLPFKSWTPWFAGSFEHSARIRFRAGFGTAAAVPGDLKLALRMLIGHYYKTREVTGEPQGEVGFGLRSLCRSYRVAADHR
jgi:uncharacterized phiE125 gp8 family phage protein